ncbi:MAG: hypothetical protein IK008_01555 [Bacteroidales bacterium]|nr:hypothetical protein [Bacteroidales bacterium]
MRGHKRKFTLDAYEHIFQHGIDYNLIFYSREDRLVFFTIFSVMAWNYGISVLALALMFNHFHTLIRAASPKVKALFIGTVTSTYAMAFNRDSGRKGALFEKAYGNAPKTTEKKIRTCVAYHYNNSVEKQLFARAEDDRWNFLAYIGNDHPFSRPIQREKATGPMRIALKEVDNHVRDHAYLSYAVLRRIYKKISAAEQEQLTDYIISRYLPIDKAALLSFYKDYPSMVLAINSNTGSEYDLKEEYKIDSDQIYVEMLEIIGQSGFAAKPHAVLSASDEKKEMLADLLRHTSPAKDYQIARLLHLPWSWKR